MLIPSGRILAEIFTNRHPRCHMAMVQGANETEGRRLTPSGPPGGVRTVLTELFGALRRKCLFIQLVIYLFMTSGAD
jgi:hypothetical protein